MGDKVAQPPHKEGHDQTNAGRGAVRAAATGHTPHDTPARGLNLVGASSPDDMPLTRDNLLLLQRTVGNRAVTQLLQRKGRLSQPFSEQTGQAPTQAKEGPDAGAAQTERGAVALNFPSDDRLPPNVEAEMEASFGADFSAVRVRQDSRADSLGALAYTQGSDIHIAPGQYDPHTRGGKELLGHELAHVLQQSDGRVASTGAVNGVPLNDDPALEREADDLGARAARGERVGRGAAAPSSGGALAQMKAKPDEGAPADDIGKLGKEVITLAEDGEKPAVTTQLKSAPGRPIQREKKKLTSVPHQIHVTRHMDGEQFKAEAMRQIFGGMPKNVELLNFKDSYDPAGSPYTVYVDIRLLKQQRGESDKERGISVGEGGEISGAEERAKKFGAGPTSGGKTELLKEIDRRYFKAVGDKTRTPIKPGETGKAELWRMLRDEVLFQHEYISNLPPQVKKLIQSGVKGKVLTPADYDRLFAIAKKIEKMPPGQASDYASKVTATTTDFDAFEASLDKYIAEMAERKKQDKERDTVMTKLADLGEVYERYKEWYYFTPGKQANKKGRLRDALEIELKAHGFEGGVEDFEKYIEKFLEVFERESANIAKDLLAKYAGKLYKESERYKDQREVDALHQKLGAFRQDFADAAVNAKIWNDYLEASNQARIPGQGHLHPKTSFSEAQAALNKGKAADEHAHAQIEGLAEDYPIFQENDELPQDRRINKVALAQASNTELGGLLQGHIQNRMKAIGEARAEIDAKPELIYNMDKLMPQFYARQNIKSDSVYDKIIQEKLRRDASIKLLKGIALAIVGIALAVVTFGAATPAIVAAGAGIAGAGLGVYSAIEEYEDYARQKKLANVGFVDNPSMLWVVLAVVGAGFDVAGAFKGVKALSEIGKAAKLLDEGGDLAKFTETVRALEKANEIEAKVARAIENAAAARKAVAEASAELTKAMSGKLYSFPGPLADPDVYKAVVKLAKQAIRAKLYDVQKFLEELKLARVNAKLGELTPQELARAKQAWEEAMALEEAEAEALKGIEATSWKGFSKGKLAEHYLKHGAEFQGLSQPQYLKAAKEFAAEAGGFQMERVGNFLVKYDPATRRTLIGHIADREIRTFYIADLRDADPFGAAVNLAKQLSGQ